MLGKLLTRLFALFGITLTCVACYAPYDSEFRPDFKATGRVVDAEGEPIYNILVNTDISCDVTDSLGMFHVAGKAPEVHFYDDDGEENGGLFNDHHIDLYIDNTDDTDQTDQDSYIKVLDLGDIELTRIDEEVNE